MVKNEATGARQAERALALSYAAASARPALVSLLALDAALAGILRSTTQPIVGQLRLAWWRDALLALDTTPAPAEPVLRDLAALVLPHGVDGATLATLIDGWDALLDEEALDDAVLRRHAVGRGGMLFAAAGSVVGAVAGDPVAPAGEGWALADLARNLTSGRDAAAARRLAQPLLDAALGWRWSRAARPLGALAHLARLDLAGGVPGSPSRTWRLLRHRLTGK